MSESKDSSWWSPAFLAPGTSFVENNFFRGLVSGDDFRMIQTHYLLCILFLLLYQLHLRSSGIRPQRLGTPALWYQQSVTIAWFWLRNKGLGSLNMLYHNLHLYSLYIRNGKKRHTRFSRTLIIPKGPWPNSPELGCILVHCGLVHFQKFP